MCSNCDPDASMSEPWPVGLSPKKVRPKKLQFTKCKKQNDTESTQYSFTQNEVLSKSSALTELEDILSSATDNHSNLIPDSVNYYMQDQQSILWNLQIPDKNLFVPENMTLLSQFQIYHNWDLGSRCLAWNKFCTLTVPVEQFSKQSITDTTNSVLLYTIILLIHCIYI